MDERTLAILDRRRRTADRACGAAGSCAGCCFSPISSGLSPPSFLPSGLSAIGRGQWIVSTRRRRFLIFALSLPAWIVVTKLYGLYDHDEERTDHSTADDVVGVFHMVTVCAWLFFAFAYLTQSRAPRRRPKLLLFWALAIVLVSLGGRSLALIAGGSISYLQNTIIVGAGDVGQLVARKLLKHPEYGINLVGFVDAEPKERREDLENLTLLGPPEQTPALVRFFDIERVIVAFSNESHEDTLDLIRSMKDLDVQVDIVPRLFELVGPGVGIHTVEGLPLVGLAATAAFTFVAMS